MGQQLALQYRNYADMADTAQAAADDAKKEVKDTFTAGAQKLYDDLKKNEDEYIEKRQQLSSLVDVPKGLPLAPGDPTKGNGSSSGSSSMPTDQTEAIQKKLENYTVKSIEDQAAIAQDAYKSRLDAITDATNRYGI